MGRALGHAGRRQPSVRSDHRCDDLRARPGVVESRLRAETIVRCVVCKQGATRLGTTTVVFQPDGATVVVTDVPARVCAHCGEDHVDADMAEHALAAAEASVRPWGTCGLEVTGWSGRPVEPGHDRMVKHELQGMIPDVPYPFTIRPLADDEGGGYLIEFPDLPGCMSDGATIEEAITHGVDAMRGWIEAMRAEGHPIPAATRSAAA